ncbi:MAG TPA: hypothetical protein VFM46_01705 [Pseudomonadales bacterium]|nr:hypothetical protein [Pseudomonadales bacterium]
MLIIALLMMQWAVNAHACASLAQQTALAHPVQHQASHCHLQTKAKVSSLCWEHCSKPGKHSESPPLVVLPAAATWSARILIPSDTTATLFPLSREWSQAHSPPLIILHQRFLI